MALNDFLVQFSGWVAGQPRFHEFKSEQDNGCVLFIRVCHTPRVRDYHGTWNDASPIWITVKVWGWQARNLRPLIHKGIPIVVSGRLTTEQWTDRDNGTERSRLVVRAHSVSPDMSYGSATYWRTKKGIPYVPHIAPGHTDGESEDPWARTGEDQVHALPDPHDVAAQLVENEKTEDASEASLVGASIGS